MIFFFTFWANYLFVIPLCRLSFIASSLLFSFLRSYLFVLCVPIFVKCSLFGALYLLFSFCFVCPLVFEVFCFAPLFLLFFALFCLLVCFVFSLPPVFYCSLFFALFCFACCCSHRFVVARSFRVVSSSAFVVFSFG